MLKEKYGIWVKFLLKCYYKILHEFLNDSKLKRIVRRIRKDCDWNHLKLELRVFLLHLDSAISECIVEFRIRRCNDDINVCKKMIITKMFICLCEMFMVTKRERYSFDNCLNGGEKKCHIHWKNHYHPTAILNQDEFIDFLLKACYGIKHEWCFVNYLLPIDEPGTINIDK